MPTPPNALPGERGPAPSGQVLPFKPHHHAQLVAVLVRAVRHRDRAAALAEGAMEAAAAEASDA